MSDRLTSGNIGRFPFRVMSAQRRGDKHVRDRLRQPAGGAQERANAPPVRDAPERPALADHRRHPGALSSRRGGAERGVRGRASLRRGIGRGQRLASRSVRRQHDAGCPAGPEDRRWRPCRYDLSRPAPRAGGGDETTGAGRGGGSLGLLLPDYSDVRGVGRRNTTGSIASSRSAPVIVGPKGLSTASSKCCEES